MKLIYIILLVVIGMIAIDTFALVQGNDLAQWGVRTVIVVCLVGAGIVWKTED